jgi:hypothetical protein
MGTREGQGHVDIKILNILFIIPLVKNHKFNPKIITIYFK